MSGLRINRAGFSHKATDRDGGHRVDHPADGEWFCLRDVKSLSWNTWMAELAGIPGSLPLAFIAVTILVYSSTRIGLELPYAQRTEG